MDFLILLLQVIFETPYGLNEILNLEQIIEVSNCIRCSYPQPELLINNK